MSRIQTLLLANHSHTDIAFTDHQGVIFRQHDEFVDAALDLIEQTADYPDEARYRWTCEASGTLEHWFDRASEQQRDRFRDWHRRGHIDVTGLQYPHFTQAITNEQAARMLYTVRTLREEHGLTVEAGVQSDITGNPWRFADLLPAAGISFLTMAINMNRALAPEPRPRGFWWEGPAGGRLLVWNGLFYLWGRSIARVGDWRFVDSHLPPALEQIETAADDYPYDFLYAALTHPTRVDNGPPDPRMPDFARRWNEEGRSPRIELTTVTAFGRMLRERHGDSLPVMRGDWTDWWTSGYGHDARSVGVTRGARHVLDASDGLAGWARALGDGAWDAERAKQARDTAILAEDLVWGAFASSAAPESLFSRSQFVYKLNDVYTAAMEGHDLLARAAHAVADTVSDRGPDGVFNVGNLEPEEAFPPSGADTLLVFNTLPWDRRVVVEEPEPRGNTAPAGMLEMYFPRDVPWGGKRPPAPIGHAEGVVPGFGYAFLPLGEVSGDDLACGPGLIENAHYRVRVDPLGGGLAELHDKDLDHDFAGDYQGWRPGQYVYEWLDDPRGRDALFTLDFSRLDCGHRHTDTPFQRESVETVTVGDPVIADGRVSISVAVTGPGIAGARCTFSLASRSRTLSVDWVFDKLGVTRPESVYVAFPFALGAARFAADLGGVAVTADEEQIDGAVRDWYPVQRWAAVGDAERTAILTALDAPLMQFGGITVQRWARTLAPDGPNLMAWPMNNRWEVNFPLSQQGEVRQRYRLTTHDGPIDEVRAARWGTEQFAEPIVLRDRFPRGETTGRFLSVPDGVDVLVGCKPADDGRGLVLRVENLRREAQEARVDVHAGQVVSATLVSPMETGGEPLAVEGGTVRVPLRPRALETVRVITR